MPVHSIHNVTGVILAGGRSTRFGSNKALALVNGKPLIQHVADIMSGLFAEYLLVTNTPEEYEFLSLPMTPDRYRECGPLAGIHAALLHMSTERAFVVACDMPCLSPELIHYLCNINEQGYDVIIPWTERGEEPLCGVYHKKSLAVIDSCLQHKYCQIRLALKDLQVRRVSEEEIVSVVGNLACFKNVNRPADL